MAIPIEREPGDEPGVERCCFCRTKTPFWTLLKDRKPGGQVACCPDCAKVWRHKDVPTKEFWCYREHLLAPKTFVYREPFRRPLEK